MTLARSASALVLVISSLAIAAGCGGRVVGNDLTQPTDPNQPTPVDPNRPIDPPVACSDIAPACDPNDTSVGSEANCGSAAYCYSRSTGGTAGCPSTLVWCAAGRPVECNIAPVCDKGDSQLVGSGCPPGPAGTSCYTRTACGNSVTCFLKDACTALPSCNAGDVEVVDIDTCAKPGVSCYPVTACNFTIHCYTP